MNPIRQQEMEAIKAANFLMNNDPNGGAWIRFARVVDAVAEGKSFAEASAEAAAGRSGRGGREGRRRA
jgi:5-methyltetrahydrofolate--homocysteine methyltransferase